MRAHDDMGKPGVNITYEDVKRAAEANGKTVDETLETIARTADKDRGDHPAEYGRGAGLTPGGATVDAGGRWADHPAMTTTTSIRARRACPAPRPGGRGRPHAN